MEGTRHRRSHGVNETIVRRGGDPALRAAANRELAVVGGLEDELKKYQNVLNDAERFLRKEQNKSNKVETALEVARNNLDAAQEVIDADPLPEKAQPVGRIQQRNMLRMKLEKMEAAEAAQRSVTTMAWESVRTAEAKVFQADKKLNVAVDALKAAEAALAEQCKLDLERSKKLGELEHTRAKRWETEQKIAIKTREDQILDLQKTAEKQIAAAQVAHVNAAFKATASTKKAMDTLEEAERLQKERWENRVQAVLELRDNQNAVRAKAATDAEKRANKIAATAKELEEQKAGLLAKGINPYAEFRQKEISAQDAALEKKLKDAVEKNKADLAVRLIREEDLRRQRDEAEAIEKEYEKKQRDELGRHVIEARNREYIASVTMDGREMLDPSGRAARIDPSQITSFPDYSLGLGKSSRITPSNMKAITERIRQKLDVDRTDLGEYQRMLGPLKEYADQVNSNQSSAENGAIIARSQSAPSGDQGEGAGSGLEATVAASATQQLGKKEIDMLANLGSKRGDMPGKGEIVADVNAQPEGELELLLQLAEDENGLLADDSSLLSTKSPKFRLHEPSKFEKDSLKRAQNRMQTRRVEGVTQVAAGKTFKGAAFVSSPAVLEYKDFQVGKVYRKKFTLTNVSYSFNSFQLLPLKDDIIDFFEIVYEKPGRMSAGVSCSLEITFTPKINNDIFGHVQLLSQTGPIDIPLQCLKRRCIPRVLSTSMDFGEVVMGQIVKKKITIKNTGAIPTEFTVSPVLLESNYEGHADVEVEEAAAVRSPRLLHSTSSSVDESKPKSYGSGEPALNDSDLASRNRLVMTEVLRQKKTERPWALAIEPSAGTRASLGAAEVVTGHLGGYSSITVDIVCAPLSLGPQDRKFKIVFAEVKDSDMSVDEANDVVTKEQFVDLAVLGEDVPVFVVQENIDFRTVLHNRIYRSKFILKNRGKSSYRADITIPAPMNKFLETSPNSLYVQAGCSQTVNIKYTPTAEMLEKMSYFMLPNDKFAQTAIMKLPLEVKVTNQDLPIFCVINSVLTSSTVDLQAEMGQEARAFDDLLELDFEKIYVNQCATRGLTLRNTSILPQKIAFVRLRKELTVSPNDGFAVLLPNESLTFDVTFTALSAIKYDLQLEVLTSQNDLYTVKVRATGIESPLDISNSVIKLRSTCPGHRVLESTMITNTTKKKQTFEVSIPESMFSWIKVSPLICELNPGDTRRLELEFLPPSELMDQDPLEWHNDIMFPPQPPQPAEPEPEPIVSPPTKGKGKGKEPPPVVEPVVEEKPPDPVKPKYLSPFNSWKFADGWVMAMGPYGGIQWTKPAPVEDEESVHSVGNVNADNGDEINSADNDESSAVSETKDEGEGVELSANSFASTTDEPVYQAALPTPGYIGNWSFPIYIKPRSGKEIGDTRNMTAESTIIEEVHSSLPMFLKVQSVIVSNQYDVDVPSFDFGQISLGTRLIRTLKFRNNTTNTVKLRAEGLNAVGPFAILNAVREVPPEEWISVVIECNPLTSGLFTECIEFSGTSGGHHMRVPLRVQGVNPTVELTGLQENDHVGKLLDFGNVVADDRTTKSFTIVNTSAFPVSIGIQRTVANGLAPKKQAETVLRNMSGLPVFTFTPEAYVIPEGGKIDIDIRFQPDRYRILPYREDLDISIGHGANNLPIKVHVCGRARARQVFVTTAAPRDEAFYSQDFGICLPEDPLSSHQNTEVRQLTQQSCEELGGVLLPDKPIVLEYPDPYRADITDAELQMIEKQSAEASAVLGGGGKAVAPGSSPDGNLTQIRRVIVSAATINDSRGTSASAITYDVVLSQEARDAGYFAVGANAKGTVAVGADIAVAIGCTLPKPKGLGGLQVGSWHMYKAEVLLKGGWKQEGDLDEFTVPILLKGFVRL